MNLKEVLTVRRATSQNLDTFDFVSELIGVQNVQIALKFRRIKW